MQKVACIINQMARQRSIISCMAVKGHKNHRSIPLEFTASVLISRANKTLAHAASSSTLWRGDAFELYRHSRHDLTCLISQHHTYTPCFMLLLPCSIRVTLEPSIPWFIPFHHGNNIAAALSLSMLLKPRLIFAMNLHSVHKCSFPYKFILFLPNAPYQHKHKIKTFLRQRRCQDHKLLILKCNFVY